MNVSVFKRGKPIRGQSRQLVYRMWQVPSRQKTIRGQNKGRGGNVLGGSVYDKLKTFTGMGINSIKTIVQNGKKSVFGSPTKKRQRKEKVTPTARDFELVRCAIIDLYKQKVDG